MENRKEKGINEHSVMLVIFRLVICPYEEISLFCACNGLPAVHTDPTDALLGCCCYCYKIFRPIL